MRRNRGSMTDRAAIFESLEDRRLLSIAALGSAWKPVAGQPSHIRASESDTFMLDEALFQSVLANAPLEFRSAPPLEIALPDPNGDLARFQVVESPVMAPELAARFPEIRTFSGQGIDDTTATLRLDITPAGLHAQVLSSSGRYYIDPYFRSTDSFYASYRADRSRNPAKIGVTELIDHVERPAVSANHRDQLEFNQATRNALAAKHRDGEVHINRAGTELRVFRTAIAAVGEYTAFYGGTVVDGLAAVVTAVNRITGIYETELSIRLELVANNDQLIYTDPATDPYTNGDTSALLFENQSNLNDVNVLGPANYDIGHVFATGGNGGLASLGVVGLDSSKALGVSAIDSPIGDGFWVDFVAHEMGHQFGADHTWNGNSGSCRSEARGAATAYEPGSGSTIMSYAGLCGNDDLQANVDPFFHSVSFDQIIEHIDNVIPTVGSRTSTGNNVPLVDAGSEFTIPARTPFALTATGSDADAADELTYSWEQRDSGPQWDVNLGDNGSSPLFRAWPPTVAPTRIFPRLSDLLDNTTVIGETLPTTTRDLNFRATVRDNRAVGGGVNSDDTVLHVVDTGAPFRVTNPNTAASLPALSVQTVTWDVAGTTTNGIDTPNVNILLSTDGGLTYPIALASRTPNDGSENIVLPKVNATQARIKVEGAENVFFDVSDVNFTIANDELAPFERLGPLGGLMFVSDSSGFVDSSADTQDFTLFVEAGQTVSAVLEPLANVSLSVELVGQSATVTSPIAGAPLVLPPQVISTSGTYTLRVGGTAATGFSLRVLRNAALEDPNLDTTSGSGLDIDDSMIPLGSGRYGVLGRLSPSPLQAEFIMSNDASLFIDISSSGTPLNLSLDGTQQIITTVGNSIFPSGIVSVANNGALAPGLFNLQFTNVELPTTLFQTALVPFWDDLSIDAGNVFWEERQVGGINTLIVQWENRSHFDFGGGVTFQVQIFESGPLLARYAYEDVIFGDLRGDSGASATVGYQESSASALQFSSNTASLSNGDVLDLMLASTLDIDEFQVDLTGKATRPIDVVLAGSEGTNLSGQTLELLGPDGTTVLATGVPDPVRTNTDAANYELGILGFQVPADGVYTVRLTSVVPAEYAIVVTESVTLDTEPNNTGSDSLRRFDDTGTAVGFLSAVDSSDQFDFYEHPLEAGETLTLITEALFDDPGTLPANNLDPELQVIHPDGTTVVDSDLDSAADGKNAIVSFTAPQTGIYQIGVRATSGSGEYLLSRIADPPTVVLSVDNATIPEAAGVATFSVTLSAATTVPVTVDLEISGTATTTADYIASGTQITVAPGTTTGTVTVTAVQDDVDEPDETVVVDIRNVTGGNASDSQRQTITIVDDDVPPSFAVTSMEPTDSGFRVEFSSELDASELNLYDTQSAGLGPADAVLTGATTGAIAGSLVADTSSVTFIKTGGPLAPDTYTVTLRSATNGFKGQSAMLLDGNSDGTGGDNYVSNFTIAEPPAGARTISMPDFARGPGQDVNLPADQTTGIPITISEGNNVRAADLRIRYNPALLEITGATAPAGGSVVVNTTTPGLAILVFFSSATLPAGSGTFINLQATVPTRGAREIYRNQQVLDVHEVTIGDGSDNEFAVVVDDALHVAAYFGDVSGNGRINASDAAQVARFAAFLDNGFSGSLNTDPIVVGDISGNVRINAADASLLARFAALIPVPEIPAVPVGVVVGGGGGFGSLVSLLPQEPEEDKGRTLEDASTAVTAPETLPDDDYRAVDSLMTALAERAPGAAGEEIPLALEEVIDQLFSALDLVPSD